MNIERMPYSPGEEEHARAHESMSEEEERLTEKREQEQKDEIVGALYAWGKESAEGMAPLIRWTERKEHEAYLRNSSKAQIEQAIETAELYQSAGYFREALEELESTEESAASEDDNFELYNKLKSLEYEIREEGGGALE